MSIRELQHYAGDYLEVDFVPFKDPPRRSRSKKSKPTSEAQEYVNQRNRERAIYEWAHENFTNADYIIHPTYSPAFLPPDEATALKDRRNFIARLRRLYRRNGKELKAMLILEKGEQNGRFHHHIIINGGVPREDIERCWGMGYCDSDRLQFSEHGLEGLSKYLVKSAVLSEDGTSSRCTFKTFSHTRNLRRPPPPKERRVSSKVFNRLWDDFENRTMWEERYKDYYFVSCQHNDNSEYGERYLTVKLCKKTAKLDVICNLDYGGLQAFTTASGRARQMKNRPPS